MTSMPQVYPIIRNTGATVLSRNRMHFSKVARSYGNRLLWGHCGCLSSAEPIYHDAVTPGERCSAGDSYAETGATHTLTHSYTRTHTEVCACTEIPCTYCMNSGTHTPPNNSITYTLAQTSFTVATFNRSTPLTGSQLNFKYANTADTLTETGKSRCNQSRHTRLTEARRGEENLTEI